jgi:protein-S-isoprenylcysteine O-methyltransferase Ste14
MVDTGFLYILLAVAVYGAVHSILASHMAKRWAERTWGAGARRFYRLFYVLIAGLALLPLLALAAILPDRLLYAIPIPWVLLTLGLQGLAVWGLLAAVNQTDAWAFIGLRQVNQAQPLTPLPGTPSLVTQGSYSLVRHPIYSFSFVLLWLLPWMSWNLLALAGGLSLYMLVGIWFEERKLVAEFGPVYAEYRRQTRMLIPWVL